MCLSEKDHQRYYGETDAEVLECRGRGEGERLRQCWSSPAACSDSESVFGVKLGFYSKRFMSRHVHNSLYLRNALTALPQQAEY